MKSIILTSVAAVFLLALTAGESAAQVQLDQEYTAPFNNGGLELTSGQSLGQTFTVGLDGTLDRLELLGFRHFLRAGCSQAPDPVDWKVTTTSGGFPTATVLASGTLLQSDVPPVGTSPATLDVSGAGLSVSTGDMLAVLLTTASPPSVGCTYAWRGDFDTSASPIEGQYFGGTSIINGAKNVRDMAFRTFVDVPAPVPPVGTAAVSVIGFGSSGSKNMQGFDFVADVDVVVTALGAYDANSNGPPNGLFDEHEVGIWDAVTQTLLTSAIVPAGTAAEAIGQYRYVSVPEITLTAGVSYVIAALVPTTRDTFPVCGINQVTCNTDPRITITDGRASFQLQVFVFPTFNNTSARPMGNFLIKIEIEPVLTADVDIKPGSFPNAINLCAGGGVTPLALIGSESFDPNEFGVVEVRVGTELIDAIGKGKKDVCVINDSTGNFPDGGVQTETNPGGPDGVDDLVCHVPTVDLRNSGEFDDVNDSSMTVCVTLCPIADFNPADDTCSVTVEEVCNSDSVKISRFCD